MCNHKLNLSTVTPNALCSNLDQMNKPNNTIPNTPNKTHSPRSISFPPSNLHPKAHDTHFPLHSLKKPGPKKPPKKPISKPSHKENSEVLQSFAMVKKSSEPKKEFRESMMEMIEENNLMTLKDLEELLECYLSLNSKEYHSVIVEVFEDILVNLMLESI